MKQAAKILEDLQFITGLKLSEISRRSGVPYMTVNQIARGKVDARMETLQAIVEGCGHSLFVNIVERMGGNNDCDSKR